MDASDAVRETLAMPRYHHNIYAAAKTPRYVVLFDLQWKIIECQRLQPSADLSSAMTGALNRLIREEWEPESDVRFGFVFLRRNSARRLLILTERDPYDGGPQSFSPFK